METIFENKYECTKECIKEVYQYINFRARPIMTAIDIIIIINLFISILSLIFPKWHLRNNDIEDYIAVGITLMILVIHIGTYLEQKSMHYKRMLEMNGGKIQEINILVTDKEVSLLDKSGGANHIEWTNITKSKETKNYYILITKTNLCIQLKKDGFTKGTAKQFEDFLKQKDFKR